MLLSLLFSFGCAEQTLNYQCSCNQIAYEKIYQEQDNQDLIGYSTIMDKSFTENVCDTYLNIQNSFESNGIITSGINSCEAEMTEIAEEEVGAENYAIDCSCECTYLSEC
jgi:hypothetical protein